MLSQLVFFFNLKIGVIYMSLLYESIFTVSFIILGFIVLYILNKKEKI